jgi:hypothetical protein
MISKIMCGKMILPRMILLFENVRAETFVPARVVSPLGVLEPKLVRKPGFAHGLSRSQREVLLLHHDPDGEFMIYDFRFMIWKTSLQLARFPKSSIINLKS